LSQDRPDARETKDGPKLCWKCGARFPAAVSRCPDDGARLIQDDRGADSDPRLGTLFDDRYRICAVLGEGGMGTVYEAWSSEDEEDVALKILKPDYIRNADVRQRFIFEARTIAGLEHGNAVTVRDFGQAPDGSFYMVMELLRGQSLGARLGKAFLNYREIFEIFPPICEVLGEAHRKGVIHRDLKPENIFLVETEEDAMFPKLLDFGIAKQLDRETLTKAGSMWGTPSYMSPEQARGDEITTSADIYSIGVILFECVAGMLPFESNSPMGLLRKHIDEPPRRLRSIPGLEVVPRTLDELIFNLLSKDPATRPSGMDEVASTLRAIRDADCIEEASLDVYPAEYVEEAAEDTGEHLDGIPRLRRRKTAPGSTQRFDQDEEGDQSSQTMKAAVRPAARIESPGVADPAQDMSSEKVAAARAPVLLMLSAAILATAVVLGLAFGPRNSATTAPAPALAPVQPQEVKEPSTEALTSATRQGASRAFETVRQANRWKITTPEETLPSQEPKGAPQELGSSRKAIEKTF
jgi:serine/threonine protein kinase